MFYYVIICLFENKKLNNLLIFFLKIWIYLVYILNIANQTFFYVFVAFKTLMSNALNEKKKLKTEDLINAFCE